MLDRTNIRQLVTDLEGGVMGDGFDGYFFNTSSDPAAVLAALEAIGAVQTAQIVRSAYSRFPGGMPPAHRDARQTALLEVVSPGVSAFETEDAAFFEYPEDLPSLLSSHEARGVA